MYDTNLRAFQMPEAITIPLQGGLDLVSPKAGGTPSTLAECYNYETADYPGYKQARGISVYSGLLKKIPARIYRAVDTSAAISGSHNLFKGAKYDVQNPDNNLLNMGVKKIQVLGTVIDTVTPPDGYVYFQILDGTFEDSGDSGSNITVVRPGGSTTLVSVQEVSLTDFSSDLHGIVSEALGNIGESRIPGSGRLNGMFVHKDRIYAARETPREWIIEFESAGPDFETFLQKDQPIALIYSNNRPGFGVPVSEGALAGRIMAYHVTDGSFAGGDATGFVKLLEYANDASNYEDPATLGMGFYEIQSWVGGGGTTNGLPAIAQVVDDGTDYAIYQHNDAGSSLFTTSIADAPESEIVWEEVDLGKELEFFDGAIRPATALTLDLTEDIEGENRRTIVQAPTDVDGGTGFGNPVLPGFSSPWSDPADAIADNSDDANVTVRTGTNGTTWHGSEKLKLTNPGIIIDRNTAITGVSVTVRHKQVTSTTNNESRLSHVRLLGVGLSAVKQDLTLLTNSATTVTIGGEDDGWGNADFNREAIAAEEFGVELGYQVRKTTVGSGTIEVGVEYVEITVHFTDGTERIFFYDGVNDVAEAKLVSWFRRKGLWTDGDAEGIMTIYDLNVYDETGTTPPSGSTVPPEQNGSSLFTENSMPAANTTDVGSSYVATTNASVLEIRNAPNGSGAVLAKTNGDVKEVYLPSSAAMIEEQSQMQTIIANFFFNKNGEAVYGVTGAGPAFLYNGKYFVNIRLPVPAELDKPRHVAEHSKHLALATKSGEIFVSVVGQPTNFGGIDGASSWGFGDTVTGLTGLYGNGLGVFCKGSIHALIGNSILSFTTQIISKSTGAIEYTVTNMGQPIYCDERGVATITASQNYGDFDWGRISRFVSPWLQERLKASYGAEPASIGISGVMPVRSSGQYKMFFNDGNILTLTLNADGAGTPEFTVQNYRNCACDAIGTEVGNPLVPTCIVSQITEDGEEIAAWGDSNGDIFILQDDITGIWGQDEIVNYQCYVVLNPIDAGLPHMNMRYNEVIIHGMVPGKKTLTFSSGTNYLLPEPDTTEITRIFGRDSNLVSTTLIPAKVHAHLPNITDGFSTKIASVGNGEPSHYLQAVTYNVGSGSNRDRAPRNL